MIISAQPVCTFTADCTDIPQISAKAAVLISASTGEVIYEYNSREKLPMASTTKIMTTLICLENGGLYDEFTVDSEAIKVEGSSMGLQEGDTVTMYALCCGMLLPSGNDAANAAAVRTAGSIPAFAEIMNRKARELGLSHTYFVTPSGLEGEGHGSSAYDMALLAREALRNETFRSICAQETMEVEFGAPPYKRRLKNTNRLLSMYDGVYGVKTGFTDEAGRCLVSACERGGMELICVTLNDRCDWEDHMSLYDYGFSQTRLESVSLPPPGTLDIVGGTEEKLPLIYGGKRVDITVSGKSPELEFTVISSPFIYAPASSGEPAAKLRISCNGREIATVPMYAAKDIPAAPAEKKSSGGKFRRMISKLRKWLF
ncbi:MAG: D-alanyl-D-alanine carboxypeptidase [Ruminococcus sp.]|nr:D-alanyl-D-alanine carboxypeptidase [Ruminococcus sp.]